MFKQRTIRHSIKAEGVGLHNGQLATMRLMPAPVDSGIVFKRVDVNPAVEFKVTPNMVGETTLCTTLIQSGVKVATIEHLMSAIAGLGIDNLLIEIDEAEVPIMDGSADPFIFLLQSAGIQVQEAPKKFVRILKPIEVKGPYDNWAKLEPMEGFRLSFSIDFSHPVFEETASGMTVDFSSTSYMREVSRARTFGFMKDVEYLRQNNLALGGSLNNAIVISDEGIMNEQGLRFDDEFVKHKILDAVGDLYVLGHTIIGHYSANKSGHALNNQVLRKLQDMPDAWEYVTFEEGAEVPVNFISSKVA